MKQGKNSIWILLIIIQTIIGTGAGLLFLSTTKAKPEIINAGIGDKSLNGLTQPEAEKIVFYYYKEQVENGCLIIEIDGNPFEISYSDIDVKVDIQKTMESVNSSIPQNALEKLFENTKTVNSLVPSFTYNSGKLMKKCEELLSPYEKEPVPETYSVKDGTLIINPAIPGTKVNYEYLEQELKKMILNEDSKPLKIFTDTAQVFIEIPGKASSDKFTNLVSFGSVSIDKTSRTAVENYTNKLQSMVIKNNEELSLKSSLDFSNFAGDVGGDLLNRITTALYQAGLPIQGVTFPSRIPAKRPVTFSEPGFEAVIDGESSDLVLRNETGKTLMLLSETTDDSYKIYIASTEKLIKGTLSSEKKDEVPPAVITIVSTSLSQNETRVVSEGVSGFTVYVYRTINGVIDELYHDKYLPISKTVETGSKPSTPNRK